ncbi:MAG: PilZ domain-containing protein [Bdellovibrionales bacterium]|nr:PilZ domain-containing protein [Bdellovibrionales bacterium]
MKTKENRAHQRVDVAIDIHVQSNDNSIPAILKNLSKAGAGIESKKELGEKNQLIELLVPLPGDIQVTVVAKIVRTEISNDNFFYGLRFDQIEKNTQKHLLSLIETLVKSSPKDRRKYARVARRIPLRFKQLHELEAILENISLGGIAMITEQPQTLYDEIEVSIPDLKGREFLILRGRVIRQSPIFEFKNVSYEIGIEFNQLNDIEKNCLHEFILHILELRKDS